MTSSFTGQTAFGVQGVPQGPGYQPADVLGTTSLVADSRLANTTDSTLRATSGLVGANAGTNGAVPAALRENSSAQAALSSSIGVRSVAGSALPAQAGAGASRAWPRAQVANAPTAAHAAARQLVFDPIPPPDVTARFAGGVDTRHRVDLAVGASSRAPVAHAAPPARAPANGLLRGQQVAAFTGRPVTRADAHVAAPPSQQTQNDAKIMTKEQLLALSATDSGRARAILNEKIWTAAALRDGVDDIRFVQYNLLYKRPSSDVRAPMAARIFRQRSVHVSAAEYGYKRRQVRSEIFPGSARIRG